jgi:hypothetical protein
MLPTQLLVPSKYFDGRMFNREYEKMGLEAPPMAPVI